MKPEPRDVRRDVSTICRSCGKAMDRVVYFTVCPHCGHNYRIDIHPIGERTGLSMTSLVPWFLLAAASATIVVITPIIVLLLM